MTDANRPQSLSTAQDEAATARLLRLAGPRAEIPAGRAERVQQAVHLHWQAETRRRAVGRRTMSAIALLATAAALILAIRLTMSIEEDEDEDVASHRDIVATIERIEGNGGTAGTARLSTTGTVRIGEWVETDATTRQALRLSDGTSVRLDMGSRARLLSPSLIELTAGALYIDTARDAAGLEVRTPFGTAHDIGTQFEIRLRDASLQLRVRTGLVELRRGEQSIPASAGTELTVTTTEVVSRTISAYGPEWAWAASLAAAFEIEGRPLAAFLEHLSREQGWTLRYADNALARDASSIVLHGSVAGLQPRQALAVALTTSGLLHRFQDGELVVFRATLQR